MSSSQACYCTNEKGKCEKNFFFVISDQDYPSSTHRPVTTKNNVKYDSIGDKKENKMNYN